MFATTLHYKSSEVNLHIMKEAAAIYAMVVHGLINLQASNKYASNSIRSSVICIALCYGRVGKNTDLCIVSNLVC